MTKAKTYNIRKTHLVTDDQGQGWLRFQISGHPSLRSIKLPIPMPQGEELVAAQICHRYLNVKFGKELADTFIETNSEFSQFFTDGELDMGRLLDAVEDTRARDRVSQALEGVRR